MAIIYEHFDGRQLGKNQSTLTYVALDHQDEDHAESHLLVTAPAILNNNHEYDDHRLVERFRDGAYLFRVTYKSPEYRQLTSPDPNPLIAGEWSFSFDTTGGSERITQSLGTRAFTSAGRASGKDDMFGNAIKVTGKAPNLQAEGVQAVVPGLKFQIRASLTNSLVTIKYARLVSRLTARTNNAAFPPSGMPFVDDQFETDTVLFLGCTGSWNSSGDIELTFHFDAGEQVSELATGDIVQIVKRPHEFVWYRLKVQDDTTNKRTVVKPDIAFVEKIYDSDDLGLIFTGET